MPDWGRPPLPDGCLGILPCPGLRGLLEHNRLFTRSFPPMEGLTLQRLAPFLMAPDLEPGLTALAGGSLKQSSPPATTASPSSLLWHWLSPPPPGTTASCGPWRPMPSRPKLILGKPPWRVSSSRFPLPHRRHSLKLHFSHLFRGDGGMVENPVQLHRRPLPVQWPHRVVA